MIRRLAVIAVLLALAAPAHAHQSAVKLVDIELDGARATVHVTASPGDLTEPLGVPADAQPSLDQAATPQTAAYVQGWLAIALPDGRACRAGAPAAHGDGKFVVASWRIECPATISKLAIDLTKFFALDRRHEAMVRLRDGDDVSDPVIVRAAEPRIVVARHGATLAGWIGFGMDHIYDGRDHIAFVLALLLVVMLERRAGGWAVRAPVPALRATAVIITSFTIAHSLSLIAAALGWIALPSRLVESLIALSILYTAIEDVIRPDVAWRFVLTFAFGLVHGLGFASVLAEQLPETNASAAVIVPLLGFNLGVELGQLTIVIVAMPVLWLVGTGVGAARYRRWVMPALASVLALLAIKWLVERALGVTTFTWLGM
ncbi:MAG TPA: HupE/UreJ family protein [Kofleriaceae bacterium]|nr:HupE/UreJ family protein [Kofleriaceae bacterium]